ncbi:hypothetical protein CFAM422_009996 [Trichoderma lentiforme]|uniref:Uncharacterized protein n=1 Tax=Trichoderma lentiforme TaxID=1567552 RepID=A0A9P5C8K7_9HYPO|nr:hypothetical protein CFAM422_009996 [Trichoderma lentiforme]
MGNYTDVVREATVLFVAVTEEDAWPWDMQFRDHAYSPKTVAVGLPLLAPAVELTNRRHGSHGSQQLMALMALPTRSCQRQRSKPLPLAKAVSGSGCAQSSALPEWSHRKSNYGTSLNVECQHGESER